MLRLKYNMGLIGFPVVVTSFLMGIEKTSTREAEVLFGTSKVSQQVNPVICWKMVVGQDSIGCFVIDIEWWQTEMTSALSNKSYGFPVVLKLMVAKFPILCNEVPRTLQ